MVASLPSFVKSRRARRSNDSAPVASSPAGSEGSTLTPNGLTEGQIKRATRTRKIFSLLTSFFLLITLVFLILVEIGNTHKGSSALTKIYFLKLDLSEIAGASIPNAALLNSIAQTIGLHDFYTVGLWNFCEGYNGEGVTHCSKPETLYWFNPVQILLNELLNGATINLPADINNILELVKLVSHWMFGLFLTGACLSAVMIFIAPLSVFSRWAAVPVSVLTFLTALTTTAASVIATVMFVIFRNVATSQPQLNIGATLGARMFAFMWIASAFAIFAWLIQMGLCCCCASRRDVKKGKKMGSRKAYTTKMASEKPKSGRRFGFGRRKAEV